MKSHVRIGVRSKWICFVFRRSTKDWIHFVQMLRYDERETSHMHPTKSMLNSFCLANLLVRCTCARLQPYLCVDLNEWCFPLRNSDWQRVLHVFAVRHRTTTTTLKSQVRSSSSRPHVFLHLFCRMHCVCATNVLVAATDLHAATRQHPFMLRIYCSEKRQMQSVCCRPNAKHAYLTTTLNNWR